MFFSVPAMCASHAMQNHKAKRLWKSFRTLKLPFAGSRQSNPFSLKTWDGSAQPWRNLFASQLRRKPMSALSMLSLTYPTTWSLGAPLDPCMHTCCLVGKALLRARPDNLVILIFSRHLHRAFSI